MTESVVVKHLSKYFIMNKHQYSGFKGLLLQLPKLLSESSRYKLWALKDINLTINKGECVGIVGKNGAGKSTLLSLIAGVIKPSSGSITTNGRVTALLALGAGFHNELTGRENIFLNGLILGMQKREISEKMASIIEYSELHEFIDQPIRVYSNGMVVKLAFSIAIHNEADILLLDEILAVGDIDFQKKCINTLLKLKNEGKTLICVSHSMDELEEVADKCVLLENGQIKSVGSSEKIVEGLRIKKEKIS